MSFQAKDQKSSKKSDRGPTFGKNHLMNDFGGKNIDGESALMQRFKNIRNIKDKANGIKRTKSGDQTNLKDDIKEMYDSFFSKHVNEGNDYDTFYEQSENGDTDKLTESEIETPASKKKSKFSKSIVGKDSPPRKGSTSPRRVSLFGMNTKKGFNITKNTQHAKSNKGSDSPQGLNGLVVRKNSNFEISENMSQVDSGIEQIPGRQLNGLGLATSSFVSSEAAKPIKISEKSSEQGEPLLGVHTKDIKTFDSVDDNPVQKEIKVDLRPVQIFKPDAVVSPEVQSVTEKGEQDSISKPIIPEAVRGRMDSIQSKQSNQSHQIFQKFQIQDSNHFSDHSVGNNKEIGLIHDSFHSNDSSPHHEDQDEIEQDDGQILKKLTQRTSPSSENENKVEPKAKTDVNNNSRISDLSEIKSPQSQAHFFKSGELGDKKTHSYENCDDSVSNNKSKQFSIKSKPSERKKQFDENSASSSNFTTSRMSMMEYDASQAEKIHHTPSKFKQNADTSSEKKIISPGKQLKKGSSFKESMPENKLNLDSLRRQKTDTVEGITKKKGGVYPETVQEMENESVLSKLSSFGEASSPGKSSNMDTSPRFNIRPDMNINIAKVSEAAEGLEINIRPSGISNKSLSEKSDSPVKRISKLNKDEFDYDSDNQSMRSGISMHTNADIEIKSQSDFAFEKYGEDAMSQSQLTQLSDEKDSIKTEVTIKYFDRSNPLLKPKLKKSQFYFMHQKKQLEKVSLRILNSKPKIPIGRESDDGQYNLKVEDPSEIGVKYRKMHSETLNPTPEHRQSILMNLSSFDADEGEATSFSSMIQSQAGAYNVQSEKSIPHHIKSFQNDDLKLDDDEKKSEAKSHSAEENINLELDPIGVIHELKEEQIMSPTTIGSNRKNLKKPDQEPTFEINLVKEEDVPQPEEIVKSVVNEASKSSKSEDDSKSIEELNLEDRKPTKVEELKEEVPVEQESEKSEDSEEKPKQLIECDDSSSCSSMSSDFEIHLLKRIKPQKNKRKEKIQVCTVTRTEMDKIVIDRHNAVQEWHDRPRPMIIITQFIGKHKKAKKDKLKAQIEMTEEQKKATFIDVDRYQPVKHFKARRVLNEVDVTVNELKKHAEMPQKCDDKSHEFRKFSNSMKISKDKIITKHSKKHGETGSNQERDTVQVSDSQDVFKAKINQMIRMEIEVLACEFIDKDIDSILRENIPEEAKQIQKLTIPITVSQIGKKPEAFKSLSKAEMRRLKYQRIKPSKGEEFINDPEYTLEFIMKPENNLTPIQPLTLNIQKLAQLNKSSAHNANAQSKKNTPLEAEEVHKKLFEDKLAFLAMCRKVDLEDANEFLRESYDFYYEKLLEERTEKGNSLQFNDDLEPVEFYNINKIILPNKKTRSITSPSPNNKQRMQFPNNKPQDLENIGNISHAKSTGNLIRIKNIAEPKQNIDVIIPSYMDEDSMPTMKSNFYDQEKAESNIGPQVSNIMDAPVITSNRALSLKSGNQFRISGSPVVQERKFKHSNTLEVQGKLSPDKNKGIMEFKDMDQNAKQIQYQAIKKLQSSYGNSGSEFSVQMKSPQLQESNSPLTQSRRSSMFSKSINKSNNDSLLKAIQKSYHSKTKSKSKSGESQLASPFSKFSKDGGDLFNFESKIQNSKFQQIQNLNQSDIVLPTNQSLDMGSHQNLPINPINFESQNFEENVENHHAVSNLMEDLLSRVEKHHHLQTLKQAEAKLFKEQQEYFKMKIFLKKQLTTMGEHALIGCEARDDIEAQKKAKEHAWKLTQEEIKKLQDQKKTKIAEKEVANQKLTQIRKVKQEKRKAMQVTNSAIRVKEQTLEALKQDIQAKKNDLSDLETLKNSKLDQIAQVEAESKVNDLISQLTSNAIFGAQEDTCQDEEALSSILNSLVSSFIQKTAQKVGTRAYEHEESRVLKEAMRQAEEEAIEKFLKQQKKQAREEKRELKFIRNRACKTFLDGIFSQAMEDFESKFKHAEAQKIALEHENQVKSTQVLKETPQKSISNEKKSIKLSMEATPEQTIEHVFKMNPTTHKPIKSSEPICSVLDKASTVENVISKPEKVVKEWTFNPVEEYKPLTQNILNKAMIDYEEAYQTTMSDETKPFTVSLFSNVLEDYETAYQTDLSHNIQPETDKMLVEAVEEYEPVFNQFIEDIATPFTDDLFAGALEEFEDLRSAGQTVILPEIIIPQVDENVLNMESISNMTPYQSEVCENPIHPAKRIQPDAREVQKNISNELSIGSPRKMLKSNSEVVLTPQKANQSDSNNFELTQAAIDGCKSLRTSEINTAYSFLEIDDRAGYPFRDVFTTDNLQNKRTSELDMMCQRYGFDKEIFEVSPPLNPHSNFFIESEGNY